LQTEPLSRRVIAAIADDAAVSVVLSVATAVADLYAATAQAIHVGEEDAALAAAAHDAGVALSTVAGPPVEGLARAAAAEDVAALVIGARGAPAGKRPVGTTALQLITMLQKPVVVVPPAVAPRRRIDSILVPLDGTMASAAALHQTVVLAGEAAAEITVAHVQQRHAAPPFEDHLPHEVDAWSREFIARYCPSATDVTLELRVGEPHEHILEIVRQSDCDLVALGWSQELAGGRAAVVRRMLAESPVPVLLAPANDDPDLRSPAATLTADTADRERASVRHARSLTGEGP
jgi:nucleotide-binding universal stress UspA family protein